MDWAPGGAEPASGSSYTVKYRYRDSVIADSSTATTITVSGGATGGDVIFSYTYKMPRIDTLCISQNGEPVYVKGVSAARDPLKPIPPVDVLPLCSIKNSWMGTPEVVNDGVNFVPQWMVNKVINRVLDHDRLIQQTRRQTSIDSKDPIAKKGLFVDPFKDDTYRDAGVAQTAAVGDEIIQLAITPTFYLCSLSAPVMLDYVEEVIGSQLLKTGCTKINPYANFNPLPGSLSITPASDFWSSAATMWASPATVEFNMGTITVFRTSAAMLRGQSTSSSAVNSTSTDEDELFGFRTETLEFLRQISISFTISGFGAGEVLDTLNFDGIDVKPGGVIAADGSGQITGTFTIPANVPAGTKVIYAEGAGGTTASALFTGQGTIDITTMRRVTTIKRQTTVTTVNGIATPRPLFQSGNRDDNPNDPQAQLFAVNEPRQIVGVDFNLCALGSLANHLQLEQVTVDNGYPTSDVVAEAFISMTGAVTGWKSGRYNTPVLTLSDRYHSFVIKTDDSMHSVSFAKLGGYDADLQQWVSAHPYAVGPRFSSVNAETWTAHQDEALAFRLVAAKYTSFTKTVALGTFAVVNASDLQVRAAVEIPSADCDVYFEIERANGTIYRTRSHQVIKLAEFITENVIVRAILTGTEKLSPTLFAPVLFIAGTLAATGTYVTRAMNFGTAVTVAAYIKSYLPAGSTAVVEYDKVDNTWVSLPVTSTEVLVDPRWVERKHSATGITASQGRLKITLTGTPAARPELADFGAAIW